MKQFIILFFLTLSLVSFSQDKTKLRVLASVGIMGGESEARPVYQLGAGLAFGRYYLGAGFGQDRYKFKSLPLFGDFRIDFGAKRLLFTYINAGYNFSEKIKEEFAWQQTSFSQSGGVYFDGGLGYRLALGKKNKLLFSAGYSRKDISLNRTFKTICITENCPDAISRTKYSLGRVSTKISWELW
jgi:hypothetical protein